MKYANLILFIVLYSKYETDVAETRSLNRLTRQNLPSLSIN